MATDIILHACPKCSTGALEKVQDLDNPAILVATCINCGFVVYSTDNKPRLIIKKASK